MRDKRSNDAVLIGLVGAGLAIMAGLALRGLVGPEESHVVVSGPGGQPMVRIERRRLPGLTLEQIKTAGLSLREAMYYDKLDGNKVRCHLCPLVCELEDGERGACAVRINLGGVLRTLIYGKLVAVHNDPIEKKPLYHFLPSSRAFSIATAGCNLGCVFCQNWQISQALPENARYMSLTPEQVVAAAKRAGCKTIAYTYTEPTVFYEFMLDCARLAKKEGIRNVWITCGYINPDPFRELCKYLDGANVDLKGFSEDFYREYCKASLEPVLTTLKIAREEGLWVEVTNLIIPGANDDPEMIRDLCKWVRTNLGPDTPLHFSRFHPNYQLLDKPPTPVSTLERAAQIAKEEGIHHVYIGNAPTTSSDDTYCPQCGRLLVRRRGFFLEKNDIADGRCPKCGAEIAGVWSDEQVSGSP